MNCYLFSVTELMFDTTEGVDSRFDFESLEFATVVVDLYYTFDEVTELLFYFESGTLLFRFLLLYSFNEGRVVFLDYGLLEYF